MHWDGYIECKSPIIQHVDGEKHRSAQSPFTQWDWSVFEKKSTVEFELRGPGKYAREGELEKGDEKTTVGFMSENIELVVVVK